MVSRLVENLYVQFTMLKQDLKDLRRWHKGSLSRNNPALYYGHEVLPRSREAVSGGIIKCMDLAQRYPNTPYNGNILYLVSSSLPWNVLHLMAIAKRAGVKIVVNQNGVAYPGWHGDGWEKTNHPLRRVLKGADYVVYQSSFSQKTSNRYLGPCRSPSTILHNPVDTTSFQPARTPRSFTLLTAGTHNHGYRVRIVLETLALLHRNGHSNLRLIVAGPLKWHRRPEEARKELAAWCRELLLERHVEVVGPYSQERAPGLFASADLLLHVQYNDVCPRLLVEAMACGVPVVYSKSGGSPELVSEEAGIGIEVPEDFEQQHFPSPEAMAEGVLAIYSRLDTYREGARNRAVTHFDVRNWLDRHEEIFHKVLQ